MSMPPQNNDPSGETEAPEIDPGRLLENIMYFARTLRAAGLPVGPAKVLLAARAVAAAGLISRSDFYWALHTVFVNRHDQEKLFDQAFHIFWRNPAILDRMLATLLPSSPLGDEMAAKDTDELSPRLVEAFNLKKQRDGAEDPTAEDQIEIDSVLTFSSKEVLQSIDFEKMTNRELLEAKEAIRRMRLPIMALPTRRFRPARAGARADLRASMRAALRSGGSIIPLRWKVRRHRHPPLVVICDISGSMSRYSRMLLHFMHAITNDRDRVHSFVFGTRLTNITRQLRQKDIDIALEQVTERVVDWSGGTRIGACLRAFNRHWARRVLGQGAIVVFISDGLDRDNAEGLKEEIERLHKSCRRLIWLNPLLRYEDYAPKSLGAQAIIPHVDDFRTVHNLESLGQLASVLSHEPPRREEGVSAWLTAAG